MSPNELRARFPRASDAFVAANADSPELQARQQKERSGSNPNPSDHSKLERASSNATLGKAKAKTRDSDRYLVRIVSVRKRLLDEDNLCPKFAVDFLRYCGAIPSDAPGKTRIETTQRKVKEGEAEGTEIAVWLLRPKPTDK